MNIRNSKEPRGETPLGTILRNVDASIELHKFLLGSFDEEPKKMISAGELKFDVSIISLNPAPPIPRNEPVKKAKN